MVKAIDFNSEVAPLLVRRCVECHKDVDSAGGLNLTEASGLRAGGESGAAVDADRPGDSLLLQRVVDGEMPPAKRGESQKLPPEEIAILQKWIQTGAEWPKDRKLDLYESTSSVRGGRDWWSLQPVVRPQVPQVQHAQRVSNPVDAFVLARLEAQQMEPAPIAPPGIRIRRLYQDLLGLPPTKKQIDAFQGDASQEAWSKQVQTLLDSPHYGERWARHWLDVVRFAETSGYERDQEKPFAWKYRDWVVAALNADKPYDRFVLEQLAGDELGDRSKETVVATGLLRLGTWNDEPNQDADYQYERLEDLVHATTSAFLGLTVQCAQCHEHKYDPISQKEFYQLYAFFNNLDGSPETVGAPKGGIQAPAVTLQASPEDPSVAGKSVMVMRDRAAPKTTNLLIGGAYDNPGEAVQRNTPAFLPPLPDKEGFYTRMDLARWLVSAEHPLTARVAVNRLWQQFFGVGLVKTAEDFGAQGDLPSHPQLLDHLAAEFQASGWDVKRLVRAMVLSQTYRQSSDATEAEYQQDPENRLLARGSRYRMDAEMIRDQILLVSGSLNRKMYGESVKPPQPPGLWKAVSMAAPFTYVADQGDKIYRRSLYTYWRRALPPPQMTILNAPSRESCIARRSRTNTPLQALLLMNEQEYFAAARRCASLTYQEVQGDPQRGLRLLYEKVTSHLPDEQQLKLMQEALREFRESYAQDEKLTAEITPEMSEAEPAQRVEMAAWTMMAHSLLNLESAKVKR